MFILALFIRLFRSYLTVVVSIVLLHSLQHAQGVAYGQRKWYGMDWNGMACLGWAGKTGNGKTEKIMSLLGEGYSRLYILARSLKGVVHTYRRFFLFALFLQLFPLSFRHAVAAGVAGPPRIRQRDGRGGMYPRDATVASRGCGIVGRCLAALSSHAVQLSAMKPLGHYATRQIGSTTTSWYLQPNQPSCFHRFYVPAALK